MTRVLISARAEIHVIDWYFQPGGGLINCAQKQ